MNFNESKRFVEQAKKLNLERSKMVAKRKLGNAAAKKITTTMVGAVAACEDVFGELWGHGKPIDNLTDEEVYWRHKWDDLRTTIFNKGNGQKRAMIDELELYSIDYEGYKIQFITTKREVRNDGT